MGYKCCVPSCGINRASGVPLHRFSKAKNVYDIWISRIGRDDLKEKSQDEVYQKYRICTRHFDDENRYNGSWNKSSLKRDAVPTLFLPKFSPDKSILGVGTLRDEASTESIEEDGTASVSAFCPTDVFQSTANQSVSTNATPWPKQKKFQYSNRTENVISNGVFVKTEGNEGPEQILAELSASNPNITVIHEVEEAITPEAVNPVSNSIITENDPLDIVQLAKNVHIIKRMGEKSSTLLPDKTGTAFPKRQVPNLVSCEKPKEAVVDSAFSETSGFNDDVQSEITVTTDLCGDPLELDQICICCLSVTSVSSLRYSFVGSVSVLTLYESISEIKVNDEEVPAMVCPKCMRLLSRVDDFVKMLNHSHKILLEASNSIKSLKTLEVDLEIYNSKKNEILHKALKQKMRVPLDDDVFQYIGRQTQSKADTSQESQTDPLSSTSQNNDIQIFQRKRFWGRVTRYKIHNYRGRVTLFRTDELPKPRVRRRTLVPTIRGEKSSKDETSYRDYCPFCCKRVRSFARHSRYTHSVDWSAFRCLKCSFHHELAKKLIEHCKSCEVTVKKEPQVSYSEASNYDDGNFNLPEEHEYKIEVGPTLVIGDNTLVSEPKQDKVDVKKLLNNFFIKPKRKKFVCNKCESFSSYEFDKVEEHVKDVHYNEKECVLCKKRYTRYHAMMYHVKAFHGKRKCCKLCLINFNNEQEAEEHHRSEAHGTCQFCGRQFQNRRQLYKHWRIHDSDAKKTTGPFKCPECPREYANRQGVKRHMAVFHKNVRYLCDTCGQSYTTKSRLMFHNRAVHQGIRNEYDLKTFVCEICGKNFSGRSKYKVAEHKAKHVGHNFVCKRCYASFPTRDLHEQHMIELNHQLFECQVCGATFVVPDAFKLHVENHTRLLKPESKSTPKEMKQWKCSYCSKILKTRNILEKHEQLHIRDRSYKCSECNQAFITLGKLKKHRRLHYKLGDVAERGQFQEQNVLPLFICTE